MTTLTVHNADPSCLSLSNRAPAAPVVCAD